MEILALKRDKELAENKLEKYTCYAQECSAEASK